jgi:glycosyltransferase involved in cell wall biosynthesis
MTIKQLAIALPDNPNTGWGLAGRRITEEISKLALVSPLNSTGLLQLDEPVDIQCNLLRPIQGPNCLPQYPHVASVTGRQDVGYCFIENDIQMRRYVKNIGRHFTDVIAGSAWAKNCMEAALDDAKVGVNVATAIQGVDSNIFCLAEEDRTDPNWFTVFSGGKFEYRKSQDVVIAAMKVMMERHADVRLIASWWNPWPATAATMRASKLINFSEMNLIDGRCIGSGLDESRVEFLGQVNHADMPAVYRRADVAFFPNRCEAGTNLPLMEAAACGLPIIGTVEHGHADVAGAIGFPVGSTPFVYSENGAEIGSWFEPDPEQAIEQLEAAYSIWKKAGCMMGYPARAMATIAPFTWERCAKSILEVF